VGPAGRPGRIGWRKELQGRLEQEARTCVNRDVGQGEGRVEEVKGKDTIWQRKHEWKKGGRGGVTTLGIGACLRWNELKS